MNYSEIPWRNYITHRTSMLSLCPFFSLLLTRYGKSHTSHMENLKSVIPTYAHSDWMQSTTRRIDDPVSKTQFTDE